MIKFTADDGSWMAVTVADAEKKIYSFESGLNEKTVGNVHTTIQGKKKRVINIFLVGVLESLSFEVENVTFRKKSKKRGEK